MCVYVCECECVCVCVLVYIKPKYLIGYNFDEMYFNIYLLIYVSSVFI